MMQVTRPSLLQVGVLDELEGVAVQVSAEECSAAGLRHREGHVPLRESVSDEVDVVHREGDVAVSASVLGSAGGRVRVRELH